MPIDPAAARPHTGGMSKRRKTSTPATRLAAVRGIQRQARIDAGVREPRAARFPDRRAAARRGACRGRVTGE